MRVKAIAGGVTEGKKCWELYRDDKERCSDCPLIKGIQLGETSTVETKGCLGGRTLQISHTGMMYEGRRAVLEIFQDITERRTAEEEARKAVNVKNEFISVVSHELRTPLAPINESVSLMLEGLTGEINDRQKKFLETIKRNSERLGRLINDVLDFQKLESGMVRFMPGQNSINDVIREVYQTMVIMGKEKGLSFDLELADDIPPISFDRDKITQVLTNLVSNAIKFTEAGGRIKITAAREDSTVHVAVMDTGFGIKKEDIPNLFQNFHQLDTAREKKLGGTGLGLAISKEIILRHKGKIWAESEFGKETAFHFVLPI